MPTYEYECQECGHRFEQFQSITDAPLTDCPSPSCSGTVKRLISAGGGLLFRGSGFYITDYRSDSYKKAAKADSGSGTSGKDSSTKDSGGSSSGSKKEAGTSSSKTGKD